MYTHYYYALSVFAITVALTIDLRKDIPKLSAWYLRMIVVGLCFLPWIKVVLELASTVGQPFRKFIFSVLPYAGFRFIAGYAVMPLNVGDKDSILATVSEHVLEVGFFGLLLAFASVWGLTKLLKRNTSDVLLILSPLVLPGLIALLISLKNPMLSERYLIVSFPFFVVLLALGFESFKSSRVAQALCVCFLVANLYALVMHHFNSEFDNTPWSRVVELYQEKPAEAVVVNPDFAEPLVTWLMKDKVPVLAWPIDSFDYSSYLLLERIDKEEKAKQFLDKGYAISAEKSFPHGNGVHYYWLVRE